ncbi:glycerate kinase [Halochromatium roseum]|uniref:glycerate kinase family protein n=1 Tax=Halochromatium roseum TaxID=391920 RepID=UPI0019144834|nr:glycerate kinase [Halochromatium roseum]MBK5939931.1 glycerate kinase [Halochromatium roseum]
MKLVLAPNAFKGSMSAMQAALAMEKGVRAAYPAAEVCKIPVADGGDGLAEILIDALHGEARVFSVHGPLHEPVQATLCHVPALGLVVVEMAVASGLALLAPEHRDPMRTTTYGTGELIRAALDLGAQRIVVGIGGSATIDGGIGMAAALGVRFLDVDGETVAPVGGSLGQIRRIDASGLDPRLAEVSCEAVCDVDNPLVGPTGAAAVYGPQKGATPEQVSALDAGLSHLADRIAADLGHEVRDLAGAGAAGGLGAGLYAFLGAELRRGVDLVLDLLDLDTQLAGADLVITGEGQIDFQTAFGKAPAGVAECAKAHGIPCIAIAGSIGERIAALHQIGIDAVFSLCPGPMTLEQAMARGPSLLAATTEQVLRCYLSGSDD